MDNLLTRMIRDRNDYEEMMPHQLFAKIQQHELEEAPTKTRDSNSLDANEPNSFKKAYMGKEELKALDEHGNFFMNIITRALTIA